jgi:hypothetical protein
MLVAENAHARRAEHEETPFGRSKAEPARRQHPEDMPAGKDDGLIIRRSQTGDHVISARADIGRLLAVRAPVAEQEPAGPLAQDFAAFAPLLVAVIPFEQVGIKLGDVAEPSERASAGGPLKRTGENPVKLEPLEALVESPSFAFALFREGDVRASRMLAA